MISVRRRCDSCRADQMGPKCCGGTADCGSARVGSTPTGPSKINGTIDLCRTSSRPGGNGLSGDGFPGFFVFWEAITGCVAKVSTISRSRARFVQRKRSITKLTWPSQRGTAGRRVAANPPVSEAGNRRFESARPDSSGTWGDSALPALEAGTGPVRVRGP